MSDANEIQEQPPAEGGKKKREKMTFKQQMMEFVKLAVILAIAAAGYGGYWLYNEMRGHEFSITDQRNQEVAVSFPSEKPTVIIFTDREAGDLTQDWVVKIMMSYGTKIDTARIVDFSSQEAGLHDLIKGILVKVPVSMGMDMDGAVSKMYHFRPGVPNIVVVSQSGWVKARAIGEFSDEAWAPVADAIDGLLGEPAAEES